MVPLVLAVAGWLAGWWLWGRPRTIRELADLADASTTEPIAVIIPARNEARVLPHLLADLDADPDPRRRVIVVDDGSTDTTAEAARAFDGVEVIPAPALPEGWAGKPWACDVGARAAAETLDPAHHLVFLDADVRVAPGAVRRAVDAGRDHGGLFSVQPHHRTERAYEQLSLFPGLVAIMATGTGRRGRRPTGAFGPMLVTSLADYQATGGHAAVRALVAEDVGLGLRYRDHGLPVTIALGSDEVAFRMYPKGVRQLIEGWTKNMATGARAVSAVWALLTALWITACASAALSLPAVPGNPEVAGAVGIALYLAFVLQLAVLGRRAGTFGVLTALVYPVALVAFIALFARSVWRTHICHAVTWRGRVISVGKAEPVP